VSEVDQSETTLHLVRLIPSPPEALFKLWTEPAQLARWWAPDGLEAQVDVLDTTVGGRWRIILRRPDRSELAMSGVFVVVEPPRRLAFTWAWEDADRARGHATEVTVSFEPAPGGTRLVLVQQRFESRQARDNHTRGWTMSFDRMTHIVG
jgi:uncharacterized protein YndB with AHSA1/START domain